MKKLVVVILIFLLSVVLFVPTATAVNADSLSDSINEQLNNLDLGELEEFFNGITTKPNNMDFFSYVRGILNGEYNFSFDNVFQYVLDLFFNGAKEILPAFIVVFIIAILCGIIQNLRPNFASDGVNDIVLFACISSIVLLLANQIIGLWENGQNAIKNISILTEIMSPIIITLMLSSGGQVSAAVYSPTVAFLGEVVINIILNFIFPLIGIILILSLLTSLSVSIKLGKTLDFLYSIFKWVIGITTTVFGVFISIQGITSATFDGISLKATKYAISNSIPMIGGFIGGGFDFIIAGSILIKNAVGMSVVVALFYMILTPIIRIIIFSLLLKFTSAIVEPISDARISSFCISMSKCLSYVLISILLVGLMLFIMVLLLTISANAFI